MKDRLLDGVLGVFGYGEGSAPGGNTKYRDVAASVLDWSEMGMFVGRPGGRHSPLDRGGKSLLCVRRAVKGGGCFV